MQNQTLSTMLARVPARGDTAGCLTSHTALMKSIGSSSNESDAGAVELSVGELRSVMSELYAALRSSLDNERDSAEESLQRVADILQGLQREQAPTKLPDQGGLCPWQIRKVTCYIETQLDQPIRNADLAAVVRLNACHFARAFRNTVGEPPHAYVIRRRIERAQGLMLSTDDSLADIALACGLADQAHLSRLFRRIVGEAPRAWRRARLGAPPESIGLPA